jgi:hypothetical protein
MTSGNGLPAASECEESVRPSELDSQPLRDIEHIIAELEVVNKKLSTRKLAGRPASPLPSREAGEPSLPE